MRTQICPFSCWIIVFEMEGTVEMSSEEYEAARILLSLKYSGDSNTGLQFPSGPCVPVQTSMVSMVSGVCLYI